MSKLINIDINKIVPNKNQPRLDFYDESIKQLADSIKENGLIQPIVVRAIDDHYEIIAGERRYRATKLLNEPFIKAIVTKSDDEESANLALVENMQREALSAIEEAMAIEKLIKMYDYTQSEVAAVLGYKQSTIANKLRLLKLSDEIKNSIAKGEITERHARALLKVDEDNRNQVFELIKDRKYNVAKTEEYIRALNSRNTVKTRGVSANIQIGLNTIKESYELCKKSGLDVDYFVTEYEDSVKVTIKFQKRK